MKLSEIPIPAVYKEESADFRFFLKWFENCLSKVQYDTENLPDVYDPLRCPEWLIWMLADTMGFKYDDRLPMSFNRLVLVYFMSMIRNKGSKDGVTLAAETNLAQFSILNYGKEKDILYNRLEDTSIPVNSVYVTPHTPEGYIEIVYFSDKIPIDACIEYVRPLGMYCFQHAGVRMDARNKISIDARLTNNPNNLGMSIGPTHVGHYSREDYSRLQKVRDQEVQGNRQEEEYIDYTHEEGKVQYAPLTVDNRYNPIDQSSGKSKREIYQESIMSRRRTSKAALTESDVTGDDKYTDTAFIHDRQPVYYRNSVSEGVPTENEFAYINPGYRALYSLQLSNNEHIVKSLVPVNPDDPDGTKRDADKIFGLGYGPDDVGTYTREDVPLRDEEDYPRVYNLRYDKERDSAYIVNQAEGMDIWVNDEDRTSGVTKPRPAVNPIMTKVGDAVSLNTSNTAYVLRVDNQGNYPPHHDASEDTGVNLHVYKIVPDGEVDHQITDKSEIDE